MEEYGVEAGVGYEDIHYIIEDQMPAGSDTAAFTADAHDVFAKLSEAAEALLVEEWRFKVPVPSHSIPLLFLPSHT